MPVRSDPRVTRLRLGSYAVSGLLPDDAKWLFKTALVHRLRNAPGESASRADRRWHEAVVRSAEAALAGLRGEPTWLQIEHAEDGTATISGLDLETLRSILTSASLQAGLHHPRRMLLHLLDLDMADDRPGIQARWMLRKVRRGGSSDLLS